MDCNDNTIETATQMKFQVRLLKNTKLQSERAVVRQLRCCCKVEICQHVCVF